MSICSTILPVRPTAKRQMSTAGTSRWVLRSGCHEAAAVSASIKDEGCWRSGQHTDAYGIDCLQHRPKHKSLLPHLLGLSTALLEVFLQSHQPCYQNRLVLYYTPHLGPRLARWRCISNALAFGNIDRGSILAKRQNSVLAPSNGDLSSSPTTVRNL